MTEHVRKPWATDSGSPALSDPFQQSTWNLDQALIWLFTRNPDAVSCASDGANYSQETGERRPKLGWWSYPSEPRVVDHLLTLLYRGELKAHDRKIGDIDRRLFDGARLELQAPPSLAARLRTAD